MMNKDQMLKAMMCVSPAERPSLKHRRTGISTRFALQTLVDALTTPGKPIKVRDHYGTKEANRLLMQTVADMAKRLGLEHLEFNRTELTVTFTWVNPYDEIEAEFYDEKTKKWKF